MKNVFEKIDNIFSDSSDDIPVWAQEILEELKEIKEIMYKTNKTVKKIDYSFYEFIKEFRKRMKADTVKEIYPKIKYNERTLGVNFKGYLYDVDSHKTLTKDEAYFAYKSFYLSKGSLHIFN